MSSDYISRLRSELLRARQPPKPSRACARRARCAGCGRSRSAGGGGAARGRARLHRRRGPTAATTARSRRRRPRGSSQPRRPRRRRAGRARSCASGSRRPGSARRSCPHDGDQLEVAVPPDGASGRDRADGAGPLRASTTGRAACSGPTASRRPTTRRSPAARTPAAPARSRRPRRRSARARGQDARVVQAESGGGYSRSMVPPALTNAALAGARVAVDPMTQDPIVELDFTKQGQRASRTSRARSRRAAPTTPRDGDPLETSHHFVMVVDDRIVSVPFINWQENPDGIDGARGAQIVVPTAEQARQLAAILDSGPLPGRAASPRGRPRAGASARGARGGSPASSRRPSRAASRRSRRSRRTRRSSSCPSRGRCRRST